LAEEAAARIGTKGRGRRTWLRVQGEDEDDKLEETKPTESNIVGAKEAIAVESCSPMNLAIASFEEKIKALNVRVERAEEDYLHSEEINQKLQAEIDNLNSIIKEKDALAKEKLLVSQKREDDLDLLKTKLNEVLGMNKSLLIQLYSLKEGLERAKDRELTLKEEIEHLKYEKGADLTPRPDWTHPNLPHGCSAKLTTKQNLEVILAAAREKGPKKQVLVGQAKSPQIQGEILSPRKSGTGLFNLDKKLQQMSGPGPVSLDLRDKPVQLPSSPHLQEPKSGEIGKLLLQATSEVKKNQRARTIIEQVAGNITANI